MKLDLAANREFVRGAVKILTEADGSFRFSRLTKEMYGIFQSDPPAPIWDYMANCPAGVRIEFTTDATNLRIKTQYAKPWGKPLYVGETDVIVNDGPIRTFRAPPLTDNEADNVYEFTCHLGEEDSDKTVRIYLGNQVPFRLLEIELDTEDLPQPVSYAVGILFVGDSITQGYFDSPAGCYAARYAASKNADFHNVSLGGAQLHSAAGLAAKAYPWNELVLAYGTNDSGSKTPEQFREDMLNFLRAATTRENAKITVISPIPLLSASPEQQKVLNEYRKIVTEMGTLFPNVRPVNGSEMIPAEDRYFADGCHPNADGMKLYTENLINALRSK